MSTFVLNITKSKTIRYFYFFSFKSFKICVIYLSFCHFVLLSLSLSVCLSVIASFYLSFCCLSVCLSVCLTVFLSVCLTVCLTVCLSVCLSFCHSVYLSVSLSVSLYVTLYVFLSEFRPIVVRKNLIFSFQSNINCFIDCRAVKRVRIAAVSSSRAFPTTSNEN